jgi:Trypsin-co-occurring domain 1
LESWRDWEVLVEPSTTIIPVQVGGDKVIQVEVTGLGGEEDIAAARFPSFDGVTDAIEEVSKAILESMRRVAPRKATVEFGLEVGVEAGQLTALLVKGSGTASIKVTLEWE